MSYIRGQKKATLLKQNVHVDWLKFPSVLKLTNSAFKQYYLAWVRARKISTVSLATQIGMDITDAARTGCAPFGAYSADLETVLQTLQSNNDHWYEDWSKNYCGPQITGALNVPVGVCNFLNAIDERAKTLQNAYADLAKYNRDVVAAKKKKRWQDIGTYTSYINDTVKNTERLLWMVKGLDSDMASKWTDGFGVVHSFLGNFNKFQYELKMGKVPAVLLSSLVEVVKKAVPIFGEVYGKAFEAIPGLVKWARNISLEREKTIRALLGTNY